MPLHQQQEQQLPHLPDLESTYRELYRAEFRANVQAGTTTPFVVPLHLFAYWVIPTLYLAIPHKNRPWLYRARWLVLAFICAFNWHMARHVSSLNVGSSYVVGTVAMWTTIWSFNLLVWTRPQWDAKRVERRRINRPAGQEGDSQEPCTPTRNGHLSKQDVVDGPSSQVPVSRTENANGVRQRKPYTQQPPAILESADDADADEEMNEKLMAERIVALSDDARNPQIKYETALRLARLARENEYEYYWQGYPAEASFWTRLDWAFDIASSFRLTGWNWAPSFLPPYEPPPKIGPYQLPLEYGLHRTKQGYERTTSRLRLVLSRWLLNLIPSYLILDLCLTVMTSDPYFMAGPEHAYPLPAQFASLHPVLLSLRRSLVGFVAIYVALQYVLDVSAVFLALCCSPVLGFRAHPWHLPSVTGSFTQVLDHGLSGFWGGWWHQTFRFGFLAPTRWLVRHGYLPPPRGAGDGGARATALVTPLVGTIIAFAQSGLIHSAASYSSVTATRYWNPFLFFALAWLGIIIQAALSHLLQHRIAQLPRWVRRLGNLTFVLLWKWATGWLLLDDFGRCGVGLLQLVPVSLARAAGLGLDRRVWRYDSDSLPKWQWGAQGRWWETGITI